MKRRAALALATGAVLTVSLAACGGGTTSAGGTTSSSGGASSAAGGATSSSGGGTAGGLITVIVNDPSNPYWTAEGDAAKAEGTKLGYQVTVAAHKGDTNTESTLVDTAIANKSRAILLDPANADGSIGAVKKAEAAKIPVILINAEINQTGIAQAQLVSNNAQGAALGAQQWVKDVGSSASYAELFGAPSDNNAQTRSNGYQTVLSQYPDVKEVAKQVANWDRTQGHDKMQSMLQADPGINAVISGNDEMALGAIAALQEAGKLSQMKAVGGFDGSPDAVDAVKAGTMSYTVLQPVVDFSTKAVDEADSYIRTGKTGAAQEKQAFDCTLITKDNASKVTAPFTLSQ